MRSQARCSGMILAIVIGVIVTGCSTAPSAVSPTGISSPLPPSPTATAELSPISTATAEPSITPMATVVADPNAALKNGPYLQSVTTDSIIVAWNTDLASSQWRVVYGETASDTSSVTDATVGTAHAVTLPQLTPYTLYHYHLENDSGPQSDDFTFRTAAGAEQAFRFVVFGDTQGNRHEAVDEVITLQPDLALHTGDLVERGWTVDPWNEFLTMEHDLMARIPLYPTSGNHESGSPFYLDSFYLPGVERWYTFDYGNARFVCIEGDGVWEYAPKPGSEQYLWLEETLASNTQPWLFVYFHVPPYQTLSSGSIRETEIGKNLMPLFKQYGVNVVFNGHTHGYHQEVVDGVYYMVTGGYGDPYYLVTVDGQSLTMKGISEGADQDVFNLSLP